MDMPEAKFVERRKEYRLPFWDKIIFADGTRAITAYCANISRGGVFVSCMDLFPIDTVGYLAFQLPSSPTSLCVKVRVAHVVFDRQRCEVDCGMGFQFVEIGDSLRSVLNLHILNEQATYQELKKILGEARPDGEEIERCLKKIPWLRGQDLLALRYRVNRICTIFEPAPEPFASDDESKIPA